MMPPALRLKQNPALAAVCCAICLASSAYERWRLQKPGRCKPCGFARRDDVYEALSWAHVELVLIHPFRDGNGRIARAFSTLMALQANLPVLDFSPIAGRRKARYFEAIQAGMDRNYEPMAAIFEELIERSLAGP